MIDVNTVLTPRQIAGLTQVGEDNPLILAYATERETLLAALDKTVTALIHHHSVRHDDCDSCTARDVGEAILRRSGGER